MITQQDLHTAVDHAVRNLRRAVRNVRKFGGTDGPVFPASLIDHPVVHLRDELVAGARVFASRESLLRGLPFPRGGTCAEVGTSTGAFARTILDVLTPKAMHIFDNDFSRFDDAIRGIPGVVIHDGDSVKKLDALPDAVLDFAYIDANHSYASVSAEIEVLCRKVRPGGYLMFNDYTRWSVTEVLPYGVLSAVNELLTSRDLPLLGIALTGTGHFDVATRLPD